MIKAIIFDFDGTIIDTEMVWYRAFRDAYQVHGVDLSVQMYAPCIGTGHERFNPFEYLVTDLHLPIDLPSFRKEVEVRHAELMEAQEMREGVMDYLEGARLHGLKIGMASSSQRKWVEHFLQRLKIRDYFECISTADDVLRVKPDPEVYRHALACLGVEAQETIAVEDSPNGAKAAKASGVYCLLVPGPLTASLEFGPVDRRLNALSDLDLGMLLQQGGAS
jgi:HAD superfamily hydrolase (TIGR01509 family)